MKLMLLCVKSKKFALDFSSSTKIPTGKYYRSAYRPCSNTFPVINLESKSLSLCYLPKKKKNLQYVATFELRISSEKNVCFSDFPSE